MKVNHANRASKRQLLAAAFAELARNLRDAGSPTADVVFYSSLAEWHYVEARRSLNSILEQQEWERRYGRT